VGAAQYVQAEYSLEGREDLWVGHVEEGQCRIEAKVYIAVLLSIFTIACLGNARRLSGETGGTKVLGCGG